MVIQKMLMVAAALLVGVPGVRAEDTGDGTRRECLRVCRETARPCVQTARTDARLCVQSTCSGEVAAVREACASLDAVTADACRVARQAARTCLQTCREPLETALRSCRNATGDCFGACPAAESRPQPMPRDPACVTQCRDALGVCVDPLKVTARECRATCQAALDQARQTCSQDPRSAACTTARRTAFDCVRPCDETLGTGMRDCLKAVPDCLRACPESSSL